MASDTLKVPPSSHKGYVVHGQVLTAVISQNPTHITIHLTILRQSEAMCCITDQDGGCYSPTWLKLLLCWQLSNFVSSLKTERMVGNKTFPCGSFCLVHYYLQDIFDSKKKFILFEDEVPFGQYYIRECPPQFSVGNYGVEESKCVSLSLFLFWRERKMFEWDSSLRPSF